MLINNKVYAVFIGLLFTILALLSYFFFYAQLSKIVENYWLHLSVLIPVVIIGLQLALFSAPKFNALCVFEIALISAASMFVTYLSAVDQLTQLAENTHQRIAIAQAQRHQQAIGPKLAAVNVKIKQLEMLITDTRANTDIQRNGQYASRAQQILDTSLTEKVERLDKLLDERATLLTQKTNKGDDNHTGFYGIKIVSALVALFFESLFLVTLYLLRQSLMTMEKTQKDDTGTGTVPRTVPVPDPVPPPLPVPVSSTADSTVSTVNNPRTDNVLAWRPSSTRGTASTGTAGTTQDTDSTDSIEAFLMSLDPGTPASYNLVLNACGGSKSRIKAVFEKLKKLGIMEQCATTQRWKRAV